MLSARAAFTRPRQSQDAAANVTIPTAAAVIDSDRLFGQHRELLIDHVGEHYRLRMTRNNKLILTK